MERGEKSGALVRREAKAGKEGGVEHRREGPGGAEGDDQDAISSLRKAALRLIPAQSAVAPLAHGRK